MKLIHKLQKLLQKPPQDSKRKKLCKTIKLLKDKQKELETRLKETSGAHERQRVQNKIDVLKAQRRKGVELYRRLKAGDQSDDTAAGGL